tara:strand:+ start:280 stop:1041 length:762 start_codon:yes stop_codon:yes gene_type:complete
MHIEKTIFLKDVWRWSKFQKYIIYKLDQYDFQEYKIPSYYSYKESTYGSRKNKEKAILCTWAGKNRRINFCRSVCINSSSYCVLNFLIIPKSKYNIPFLGIDFVSLPNYHLLVLDFQPSLHISKQFDKDLLQELLIFKDEFHQKVPKAAKMSEQIAQFFSPGVIWSKLPKEEISENLIKNILYPTFQKYLDLYLNILHRAEEVELKVQKELINGQINYLEYRKSKDPARPMLKVLFGETFTESLIKDLLFKVI